MNLRRRIPEYERAVVLGSTLDMVRYGTLGALLQIVPKASFLNFVSSAKLLMCTSGAD
jgi:hypothetical protein